MEKISATLKKENLTDSEGRKWRIVYKDLSSGIYLVERTYMGKIYCGVFRVNEIEFYPVDNEIILDIFSVYVVTYHGWQKKGDYLNWNL